VIVYQTFLFAPGLPILFPIALFGLVIQLVTNKLALAYFNKRPTVYDVQINYYMLRVLKAAPLLYIAVAAWVYSN